MRCGSRRPIGVSTEKNIENSKSVSEISPENKVVMASQRGKVLLMHQQSVFGKRENLGEFLEGRGGEHQEAMGERFLRRKSTKRGGGVKIPQL